MSNQCKVEFEKAHEPMPERGLLSLTKLHVHILLWDSNICNNIFFSLLSADEMGKHLLIISLFQIFVISF